MLPVVNALKRAFPRAHLTWVVQPPAFSLVAGHPGVDEFVVFQRRPRGRVPRGPWESARGLGRTAVELRRAGKRQPGGCFDLVLGLQVYFKAGILTALAPGSVKLGFDRKRARDLNFLFTTHRIPPCPEGFAHTQDQYFEFLHYLGVDPEPVEYGLRPTPGERIEQRRFFGALERPVCSVVMATSDARKDWCPDGYARVIEGLHFDLGLHPILVGGGSPRERRMAREVERRSEAPVLEAMRDDLRRLLWLLEGSALVISPDTGPLHMARAVGVPVVGLYGFTNPKRSGPYRLFEDLVVDGYALYPGEEYPVNMERRRDGMGRVTPEMVLEKSALAMERYHPPKR